MLGTLSFERTDTRINAEEVQYWKRMIKSNLKIGVEIETNLDRTVRNSEARDGLSRVFSPTNSFGDFGKFGVLTVKGDGSLDNGIELCTIGRRLNFLDLYNQYNAIIAHIFRYKPIMNERAGLHNHILMDYGDNYNSLEKPMPGVIVKNFVQLLKRHMPELVWITSTVNTEHREVKHITRMEKFCNGNTLLKTTPLTRTVEDFKDKIMYDERYKFLNMNPLKASNDEVTKFHVELRFPDGSLYPAQIASQNMLYASMLIKAVELSEIGIINCGNAELWEETKLLYSAIRNSAFGYEPRLSAMPSDEQLARIKARSKDMLLEFKSQLDSFDTHTYMMLSMLADNPVSILRQTKTDIEVNQLFESIINSMYTVDLSDCSKLLEYINLNKITGCYSEENWNYKASQKAGVDISVIRNCLFKMKLVKSMEFDKVLGSYVFR